MGSNHTIDEYRRAAAILGTAVANEFRAPFADAEAEGKEPLVLDPHELRAALAVALDVLDSVHGIAAGVAANIRLAQTPDNADVWVTVEQPTPDLVARSGEPTIYRLREEPTSLEQMGRDWRESALEQLELPALRLASLVGEAIPEARQALMVLRELTSLEPVQASTGLPLGYFTKQGGASAAGYWTYRRELQDNGFYKVVLGEPVDRADVDYRPRPVEPLGTELDETDPVPDKTARRRSLDLDSPDQLAVPDDHGWVLEPQRTHPAGATEPTREEGLHKVWNSQDGKHQLGIFWVTTTRITSVDYDGDSMPLNLDLVNLLITGTRS